MSRHTVQGHCDDHDAPAVNCFDCKDADLGHWSEDHGFASEWPFTCRCLDCGYVGWPNSTQQARGGPVVLRHSCPRSQAHREMVRIRITDFEEAPRG